MAILSSDSFLFKYYLTEKEGKNNKVQIVGGFLCDQDSEEESLRKYFHTSLPGVKILRALQVHESNIASLFSQASISQFLAKSRENRHYDGIITDQVGYALIIRSADCVPILFYSRNQNLKNRSLIGGIHCGWKPLVKGIIKNLADIIDSMPKAEISDFRFHIGPAICQQCYEVGIDVICGFEKTLNLSSVAVEQGNKKYLLDLKNLSKFQLMNRGVSEDLIEISDICTRCHPAFHSHRENKTPKRNINFISMIKC